MSSCKHNCCSSLRGSIPPSSVFTEKLLSHVETTRSHQSWYPHQKALTAGFAALASSASFKKFPFHQMYIWGKDLIGYDHNQPLFTLLFDIQYSLSSDPIRKCSSAVPLSVIKFTLRWEKKLKRHFQSYVTSENAFTVKNAFSWCFHTYNTTLQRSSRHDCMKAVKLDGSF